MCAERSTRTSISSARICVGQRLVREIGHRPPAGGACPEPRGVIILLGVRGVADDLDSGRIVRARRASGAWSRPSAGGSRPRRSRPAGGAPGQACWCGGGSASASGRACASFQARRTAKACSGVVVGSRSSTKICFEWVSGLTEPSSTARPSAPAALLLVADRRQRHAEVAPGVGVVRANLHGRPVERDGVDGLAGPVQLGAEIAEHAHGQRWLEFAAASRSRRPARRGRGGRRSIPSSRRLAARSARPRLCQASAWAGRSASER